MRAKPVQAIAILLAAFVAFKGLTSAFGDHMGDVDYHLLAGLCWLGAAFGLATLYRR